MRRWSSATAVVCSVGCLSLLAIDPLPSGASDLAGAHHAKGGPSIRVTPSRALVKGEVVTVEGRGLTRPADQDRETWFVIECTSAVRGRMRPSTDIAHCDVTAAHGVHVGRNGKFSTTFRIRTGIVGDGYCGTHGHLTCELGVATAAGRGKLVRITFKGKHRSASTPTASTTTTARSSPAR